MKHIKRMNEALQEIERRELKEFKGIQDRKFSEEDLQMVNNFLKENYVLYRNSPFYSLTAKMNFTGAIDILLEIDRVPLNLEFKKKTGYENVVSRIKNTRIQPVKLSIYKYNNETCVIYDDTSNIKQVVLQKKSTHRYYKCKVDELLESIKTLLNREEDIIRK